MIAFKPVDVLRFSGVSVLKWGKQDKYIGDGESMPVVLCCGNQEGGVEIRADVLHLLL